MVRVDVYKRQVLNSAALSALGIDSDTPDPKGGVIGRVSGSREPNGYLEETAFTTLASKMAQPSVQQLCSQLEAAQDIYCLLYTSEQL